MEIHWKSKNLWSGVALFSILLAIFVVHFFRACLNLPVKSPVVEKVEADKKGNGSLGILTPAIGGLRQFCLSAEISEASTLKLKPCLPNASAQFWYVRSAKTGGSEFWLQMEDQQLYLGVDSANRAVLQHAPAVWEPIMAKPKGQQTSRAFHLREKKSGLCLRAEGAEFDPKLKDCGIEENVFTWTGTWMAPYPSR